MKAVGDGGVDDGSGGAGFEVGVRGWCSGVQGQLIKSADDAAPGVWRGRNLTSGKLYSLQSAWRVAPTRVWAGWMGCLGQKEVGDGSRRALG